MADFAIEYPGIRRGARGLQACETAALISAEELGRSNRADRWMATTMVARVAAALLIMIGGLMTFATYVELTWR